MAVPWDRWRPAGKFLNHRSSGLRVKVPEGRNVYSINTPKKPSPSGAKCSGSIGASASPEWRTDHFAPLGLGSLLNVLL
jgi:hypothetical protein